MRKIAVRTEDFRLSFHLMRELKRRKCDFVMLSPEDKWDGILLTSPEEVKDGEIPATEETLEISVERAIQASRGFESVVYLESFEPKGNLAEPAGKFIENSSWSFNCDSKST